MGHKCSLPVKTRTFVTSRMAPDGVDLLLYEARNMKALEAVNWEVA
jgi:hypothetical protein